MSTRRTFPLLTARTLHRPAPQLRHGAGPWQPRQLPLQHGADGSLCQESRLEGIAHSHVEVCREPVLKIRVVRRYHQVGPGGHLGSVARCRLLGCPCGGHDTRCLTMHHGAESGGHHDPNQGGGLRMDLAAHNRHTAGPPVEEERW